ncbi:hypothetical protein D3C80_1365680 [compost metagenome]
MVADDAVVTDMGIGHDQVVVAKGGLGAILDGTTVNGHAFADDVMVSDDQPSDFALVLEVGRVFTYRGKLIDAVVFTNPGRALEYHVWPDDRTLADFHTRANDRPGADLDARGQYGHRIDDCARVNQTHSLRSAQMISAEHTGLPSTEAWQSNFQIWRLQLMNLASRIN